MKLRYILLSSFFVIIAFGRCHVDRSLYRLDALQGDWRRIGSNNPDADMMLLRIEGSDAVILEAPPNSNFYENDIKWTKITSVASPKGFTLLDKSTDGQRLEAFLVVKWFYNEQIHEFTLTSNEFPKAPGGTQTWIRED